MFKYCGLNAYGSTVLFNNQEDVKNSKIIRYFEIAEPIPEGEGVMKTDGVSKIWWEPFPEPPKPEPDRMSLLQAQIKALSDQNEFLEDCIVEMAGEIYS